MFVRCEIQLPETAQLALTVLIESRDPLANSRWVMPRGRTQDHRDRRSSFLGLGLLLNTFHSNRETTRDSSMLLRFDIGSDSPSQSSSETLGRCRSWTANSSLRRSLISNTPPATDSSRPQLARTQSRSTSVCHRSLIEYC